MDGLVAIRDEATSLLDGPPADRLPPSAPAPRCRQRSPVPVGAATPLVDGDEDESIIRSVVRTK
jgi:hypothetical protein